MLDTAKKTVGTTNLNDVLHISESWVTSRGSHELDVDSSFDKPYNPFNEERKKSDEQLHNLGRTSALGDSMKN